MTTPIFNTPPTLWERACSRKGQHGLSDVPSRLLREQARSHMGLMVCSLALAVSLAGCAGLPDQRLANEALKRGDTATAERNYKALADLGYSDAQVGLADGVGIPAQVVLESVGGVAQLGQLLKHGVDQRLQGVTRLCPLLFELSLTGSRVVQQLLNVAHTSVVQAIVQLVPHGHALPLYPRVVFGQVAQAVGQGVNQFGQPLVQVVSVLDHLPCVFAGLCQLLRQRLLCRRHCAVVGACRQRRDGLTEASGGFGTGRRL